VQSYIGGKHENTIQKDFVHTSIHIALNTIIFCVTTQWFVIIIIIIIMSCSHRVRRFTEINYWRSLIILYIYCTLISAMLAKLFVSNPAKYYSCDPYRFRGLKNLQNLKDPAAIYYYIFTYYDYDILYILYWTYIICNLHYFIIYTYTRSRSLIL